jgi:glycosyltransferase involved in cell wall biosynthesis
MGEKESSVNQISVVIPAYNEEQGISNVIAEIRESLRIEHEILIIDDGSEDKTGEIAADLGVRVIRHKRNRGYGAALKTGIRNARYDFILITDADGTYDCQPIMDLVSHLNESQYSMVVGARVGEYVSIPLMRKPAKWLIARLAQYVAGSPILDVNSGLRIFKRSVALRFLNSLPDGFSFTTTITLGMLINHYSIGYLPICYHPRVGKSKIRPIRDTGNFIRLIFQIALYFVPLKIFLPISGILLILALGWGMFTYYVLGKFADVSTIVIVMAAFQIAVVGLLAELINHRIPNQYHNMD